MFDEVVVERVVGGVWKFLLFSWEFGGGDINKEIVDGVKKMVLDDWFFCLDC